MRCANSKKKWLILLFILSIVVSGMCFNLSEADSFFGTVSALDFGSGSAAGVERTAAQQDIHIINTPSLHSSHDLCTGEYLGLRTLRGLNRQEKDGGQKSSLRLLEVLLLIAVLPLFSFYIRNVVMWIQTFQGESRATIIHYIQNQDGEKGMPFVNR